MTHRAFSLALLSLFTVLAGCGGEPAPEAPSVEPTAGAEVEAEPIPTGPPPTHVAADHTIVLRLDMTRVRDSAIAEDIGGLVRSYPTWEQLLGRSGIDPVRDFDRVLVSGASGMGGRGVMVIRHRLTEAQVRQAVLDMSAERGSPPTWREVDGFSVVDWPADTEVPRLVVLTADHELVVTTAEGLDRVIEVAHDHRLRRQADETIEPQLAIEAGTIATVTASEVGEGIASRIPHPPQAFELALTDDPEEQGRVHIDARGTYPDASAAESARSWVARQRDQYAGHMMVRAVGLDRPLREAEIGAEGEQLTLAASFTEEEIQRVIGLLALLQLGSS